MKLTAAHELPGDIGRLQLGAFRRRMGSEIAGDHDEDMPALVGIDHVGKPLVPWSAFVRLIACSNAPGSAWIHCARAKSAGVPELMEPGFEI
jgi:hypothetical protein